MERRGITTKLDYSIKNMILSYRSEFDELSALRLIFQIQRLHEIYAQTGRQ